MAKFTATLSAQSTNVKICEIKEPRKFDSWFANAMVSGTFGGGTVTFGISFDGGTTIYTLNQDGTNSVASATAAGSVNLRCGTNNKLTATTDVPYLYAAVGTATNPSLSIIVLDNR